ncbi:MAG: dTDP-4-dehydrorhamnose reductase [Conexibacter sp.]|nr:dTDP-4-dehydrorhamnose reductase [Conexibacter sp.]
MRLLVTGAAGMLGQDVVRAARARGWEPLPFARAELDVTDAAAVEAAIAAAAPDAVVNCAAWTDVDGAESDAAGAGAINATAAGVLARASAAAAARLVQVSTDYVFDGERGAPYVESDATAPRSVYGSTKLDGEHAVAAAGGSHAIARTQWLFGAGGRNFAATMLALGAERDEVTVVTDQLGLPTATAALAVALLELAAGESQGVHHLAGGGEPVSWHGFTLEIFRQAGLSCRVLPCTTAAMPRPAPRPAFSALASERPETPRLPPWQDGLAHYLERRKVHA